MDEGAFLIVDSTFQHSTIKKSCTIMQVKDERFEAVFYSQVKKTDTYKAERTKNKCYINSIITTLNVTKTGNKIIVDGEMISDIIEMLE